MNIHDVIAALTARLGPPDKTGMHSGNPTASWGETVFPGPGVDCFVYAPTESVRVDIYTAHPNRGMRLLTVAEARGVDPVAEKRRKTLDTADAVDAYAAQTSTIVWPAFVPLAAIVECAARAMGRP